MLLSVWIWLQVLVEQSLLGWKEFELEVMRDMKDNVVIICSIENVDPMGVHTGDSITIAPAQTLTDKEYQRLRDAAVAIIREMGVETGLSLTTSLLSNLLAAASVLPTAGQKFWVTTAVPMLLTVLALPKVCRPTTEPFIRDMPPL